MGVFFVDTFVEQIVQKKKTGKEIAVVVAVAFGFAVVAVATWLFFPIVGMIAPILLFGAGYGAWWLITAQNVEFEYCVTNGDIDVDQIIARRKRKRIVSVSSKKIEAAGRYDAARFQGRAFDRVVMAATSPKAEGLYYFTYYSKKRGRTLVVFEPNERVKAAFGEALPRLVQMDWDKA